jgi:hypothetical protein
VQLAAWIFICAGLVYGAFALPVILAWNLRSFFVALVALSLCYQGFALLRRKKDAWKGALASSIVLMLAGTAMLAMILSPLGTLTREDSIPVEVRPTLIALATVTMAFALAAGAIFLARRGESRRVRLDTSVKD